MNDALVSIVIPTLNSGKLIKSCLESIRQQTYKNIEIIVVDAYSSDNTIAIAEQYGARCLTYGFHQSEPFAHAFKVPKQRNYGVMHAKGKYVYYVDSDMTLTPNLIEECVKTIETNNGSAVIVPEYSWGEGFWSHCRALEKSCYNDDAYIDAARFIRKEVWDKLGGLDVTLGGFDDWDFQQRLNQHNFRTLRVNSFVWHYENRLTLKKQFKKKFVYGKYILKYLCKHRNDKKRLVKQYLPIRPAFIRHFDKLLRDPSHAIGLIVLKAVEYFAAFLGMLFNQFANRNGKT